MVVVVVVEGEARAEMVVVVGEVVVVSEVVGVEVEARVEMVVLV